MRFLLKNSSIFPMPNSKGQLLHLGTIEYSLREFVVMLSPSKGQIFIEEVVLNTVDWAEDVFANCKHIKDDSLFADLSSFSEERGLTDMKRIADTIIDQGKIEWLIGSSF